MMQEVKRVRVVTMRDNLFVKKTFTLHSGNISHWKIECDALTDEDIETIAYIISNRILFKKVIGVPRGGFRIAKALEKYKSKDGWCLIVDDVLTTGNSMDEARRSCGEDVDNIMGIVIFARGECPSWVMPVFRLYDYLWE